MKTSAVKKDKEKLPDFFKPLLWSLKWEDLDIQEDKEDIIVAAVNEGTLDHWRWIIDAYGKEEICRVLGHRLSSEFHAESRNLAKVIFGISEFKHARTSPHS